MTSRGPFTFLRGSNKYFFVYFVSLYLVFIYFMARWPIVSADTDMWYHLNAGRYIFENGEIPDESFFSFITPPRQIVDYFWLFQAFIYKIYSFSGYYGLIYLRVIVFSGLAALLAMYLFKKADGESSSVYHALIFTLYFFFFLPRYQLVRPHTLTFIFIAAFLYILEYRPRKMLYIIPLLSILWVNFHGIEYPVLLLIVLSYLFEFFVNHIRTGTHIGRAELSFIIASISSVAAVYFTPHGLDLIGVPFTSTTISTTYINELRPVGLKELTSFHITAMVPEYFTIFNVIFIAALLMLVVSFLRRNIRISHLLMFAGGIILLSRAIRFEYECVLLMLPVLKANAPFLSFDLRDKSSKRIFLLIIGILAAVSFITLKGMFVKPPRFPLSPKNLPEGVAVFLKRIPAGGSVFNHANSGGYLEWMLYPKYKIYMDMQTSNFLFTDDDFMLSTAFKDETVLRKVLSRYDLSFITVPMRYDSFYKIIKKFPDYVLVFFDDVEVLYMNKRHYPALAVEHEVKDLNPFELAGVNVDSTKEAGQMEKTLLRLADIYPECGMTNQILAILYNKKEDYARALRHAEIVVRNFPESPVGYRLRADSLKGLGMSDKAISNYEMSIDRETESAILKGLNKELGLLYLKKENYKKAYHALEKAIDIFNSSYKDLYYLGTAAFLSGKMERAVIVIGQAYMTMPPSDKEWNEKILRQMSIMKIEPWDKQQSL